MNTLETTVALMNAWEARDVQAVARLLSDDFQVTGPAPEALGRDAYVMFQAVHNEAFPDWQFNPSEVRAQGDKVYVTFQIHATHSGTFDVSKLGLPIPPIPATGKSRDWPVEHLTATVRDGKVTHLEIKNEPGGGVGGTLAWLGAPIPAMA